MIAIKCPLCPTPSNTKNIHSETTQRMNEEQWDDVRHDEVRDAVLAAAAALDDR